MLQVLLVVGLIWLPVTDLSASSVALLARGPQSMTFNMGHSAARVLGLACWNFHAKSKEAGWTDPREEPRGRGLTLGHQRSLQLLLRPPWCLRALAVA